MACRCTDHRNHPGRTYGLFDTISISTPRLTAAILSVAMLLTLIWFLYNTWTGRALRQRAGPANAAVMRINPGRMNMLAFGLGCMLAGLAGAVLVQAFSWLPQTGAIPALRAFVIIVLGGLGSLPGAFIGGLILGLVEAAGAGCVPDQTRAAAYLPAYGMIVTLVLLLRPQEHISGESMISHAPKAAGYVAAALLVLFPLFYSA